MNTRKDDGDAQIKYMMPARYAVEVIPPEGETWHQTSTIDGTPYIEDRVKLNESAKTGWNNRVVEHCFYSGAEGLINAYQADSQSLWAST